MTVGDRLRQTASNSLFPHLGPQVRFDIGYRVVLPPEATCALATPQWRLRDYRPRVGSATGFTEMRSRCCFFSTSTSISNAYASRTTSGQSNHRIRTATASSGRTGEWWLAWEFLHFSIPYCEPNWRRSDDSGPMLRVPAWPLSLVRFPLPANLFANHAHRPWFLIVSGRASIVAEDGQESSRLLPSSMVFCACARHPSSFGTPS